MVEWFGVSLDSKKHDVEKGLRNYSFCLAEKSPPLSMVENFKRKLWVGLSDIFFKKLNIIISYSYCSIFQIVDLKKNLAKSSAGLGPSELAIAIFSWCLKYLTAAPCHSDLSIQWHSFSKVLKIVTREFKVSRSSLSKFVLFLYGFSVSFHIKLLS